MEVLTMHQNFRVFYDKVEGSSNKNFEPEEIDVILNTAQLKKVKEYAQPLNIAYPGMENTSKRVADLSNLIKNHQVPPLAYTAENKNYKNKYRGSFYLTPDDLFIEANEELEVQFADCLKRLNVIPTTHDRYNKIVRNPFQNPNSDECLKLPYGMSNNKKVVEIITNIQLGSPVSYILRYYKYPRYIYEGSYTPQSIPPYQGVLNLGTPQNSELSDELCDEIIHEAVSIALETIESPRYQSQRSLELNNN